MHWIALQPLPEAELSDALTALGWWALQFSPKVARCEDAVLLEVSASERLWGGAKALLNQIVFSPKPVAKLNYALGATSLIALARLQLAQPQRTQPDELPLAALAAARAHLATLQRIGCTQWGQLRALPRAAVVRRFDAALLDALDRAYGEQPEIYPWLVLPEVFEAALELSFEVQTAPALLFAARRLLKQLGVWLQMRQRAARSLVLNWSMDRRRDAASEGELVLRSAEPTCDMTHMGRLLAEHLARIRLPAPVLGLRLRTLETQQLVARNASLLNDESGPGESLQQLLERLSVRLGAPQVLQMQAQADHRPERMQRWQAASSAAQLMTGRAGPVPLSWQQNLPGPALYPTWLLAKPVRLALHGNVPQYQGALTLMAGPQRLETGWWGEGGSALRDYFLARSSRMGLLWIYRERLTGPGGCLGAEQKWYLHGLFA